MAATELKRYFIKPDTWDEFLDVMRRIVKIRVRHGFGVVFAFADRETNVFTWAVNHPGDFDAAAKAYYDDPDRVELKIVEDYVTDYEIRKVELVQLI
tara:strand:- start:184 stop:474 length:291 start_codon:yes stop_codon:yes gene_type:complete